MKTKAFHHVAKRDAQFYAIGLAMTILEVALFATNVKFGSHALEMSFLIQIILTLSVESAVGIWCLKYGAIKTTIIGFGFKIIGVCFLVIAHILSFTFPLNIIWSTLLAFFVTDAAGSSCLLAAYRPAYFKWYQSNSDDVNPINFLEIVSYSIKWRLGLPITILTLSVLVFWIFGQSGRTISIPGAIVIFSAMIILRVTQLLTVRHDFTCISDRDTLETGEHLPKFRDQLKTIFRQMDPMLIYVVGNLSFLSVTLYYVGIIYQTMLIFNQSFYIAWLGGSIVGFSIYAISTVLSPLLFSWLEKAVPEVLFGGFISAFSLAAFLILLCFETPIIKIISLFIFSLIAVIFGNGLQRKATNHIASFLHEKHHQAFFLLGETLTGILIGLCMLISTNIGSIHLASMVIMLAVSSLGVIVVLRNRVCQCSTE